MEHKESGRPTGVLRNGWITYYIRWQLILDSHIMFCRSCTHEQRALALQRLQTPFWNVIIWCSVNSLTNTFLLVYLLLGQDIKHGASLEERVVLSFQYLSVWKLMLLEVFKASSTVHAKTVQYIHARCPQVRFKMDHKHSTKHPVQYND